MRVVLYGRPGCHLCDEAREQLLAMRGAAGGFELREIDIESDDALLISHLERIPVVEVDGRVVSELELDAGRVQRALVPASG
ncbi:MAG: glutaredoxin family protein [bacterium]